MNPRFYIICSAVLIALVLPVLLALGVPFLSDSNVTATVHGATYAIDTFEPLNDTIISLNSNPAQSIVAKNGIYSFELAPGDYIITARCYRNNTLVYTKETALKIEDNGNYVLDLLLYPVPKNQTMETSGKVNSLLNDGASQGSSTGLYTIKYLIIVLSLFFLFGGVYKLSKAFGKSRSSVAGQELANIEEPGFREPVKELAENSKIKSADLKNLPLSTDLNEALVVIKGNKGRITQKELRNRLDYSEVKVSLLLSELEKRGHIKKLKNGRENILLLVDEHPKFSRVESAFISEQKENPD